MTKKIKITSVLIFFGAFLLTTQVVQETKSMEESTDRHWWVNSGAYLKIYGAVSQTNHGELPQKDKWRILYASNNPLDTDNGFHPQNIFRLISRQSHQDFIQEVYFRLDKYRPSESPNRDMHNGMLLIGRYVDDDNLYYSGLRVDGNAVIKKKYKGRYYTLALKKNIEGVYSRNTNPNLIPIERWIGLRNEIADNPDGSVSIKLYVNMFDSWELVAEVIDNGTGTGGKAIRGQGFTGIRTDFMDASFMGYTVR